ncbi:MAG: hypothetical protein M3Q91_09140 [Acidobacteriota bacterium]|nr:hypothetical protein [Acidobacteriota bacterium]
MLHERADGSELPTNSWIGGEASELLSEMSSAISVAPNFMPAPANVSAGVDATAPLTIAQQRIK